MGLDSCDKVSLSPSQPPYLPKMSYYFCIVGTRDNPLYEADLASKPVTDRSGPSSFFSSSNNSSNQSNQPVSNSRVSTSTNPDRRSTDSGLSDVFGFGSALSTLAGGLNRRDTLSQRDGSQREGAAAASGNVSAEGKGLGFGRYNDKHVLQMIAHSSLDTVEDVMFVNSAM